MDRLENEIPVSEQFVKASGRWLRFGRYVLSFVLAALLIGVIAANRESINLDSMRRLLTKLDLSLSGGISDGSTIEFDYDVNGKVAAFKDGLVYLTPSKLTVLDNRGAEFFSVDTGYTDPAVLTTGRYVIAYDRGGKHILVINSFSVLFEQDMDEPILTVSANEKGYFAVITLSDRFHNTLRVFDADFQEVFNWQSADRYLLDVAIAPDHEHIVLSAYNVSEGKNQAELVCVRLGKEELYWTEPLTSGLPLAISFKTSDTVCVLHENALSFYNTRGECTDEYTTENSYIQQFSIAPERYSVLVLSDSQRGNSTLYIINNRGRKTEEIAFSECVENIGVSDNRIALLGEENTYLCASNSSRIRWQKENQGNVQAVCLGGKNDLFDIYTTKAVYNDIQ